MVLWDSLDKKTLTNFEKKVLRISRKCWPKDLQMTGNLTWLYHNHSVFSGNVPLWADWEWPMSKDRNVFITHFYSLLTSQNPAGGSDACCCAKRSVVRCMIIIFSSVLSLAGTVVSFGIL